MSVHNLSENLIDQFCCRHRILCTFQGCCVVVPSQAGQHNLVFLWQTFSSMHQFGKSWKTTFFPFSLNLYFRVPGSSVNALIGLVCPRKCSSSLFYGRILKVVPKITLCMDLHWSHSSRWLFRYRGLNGTKTMYKIVQYLHQLHIKRLLLLL